MLRQEFDDLMVEKAGWTFPPENYERIEQVYLHCEDSKSNFVDFCIEKDMNGIEFLYAYRRELQILSHGWGLDIAVAHLRLKILFE